jgi:hypothetical protein
VDSTYIRADASFKSLEPIVVAMDSQKYIETLEREIEKPELASGCHPVKNIVF